MRKLPSYLLRDGGKVSPVGKFPATSYAINSPALTRVIHETPRTTVAGGESEDTQRIHQNVESSS